jgi:hypothetical protein
LLLPLLALGGRIIFIKTLIRFFDHLSRLLAYMGVKLVTQRET